MTKPLIVGKGKKKKTEYDRTERERAMFPANRTLQPYLDAGVGDDTETPLCWGIVRGKVCVNLAAPGSIYCGKAPHDAEEAV